jgi:hypothetical protein
MSIFVGRNVLVIRNEPAVGVSRSEQEDRLGRLTDRSQGKSLSIGFLQVIDQLAAGLRYRAARGVGVESVRSAADLTSAPDHERAGAPDALRGRQHRCQG